MCTLAGQNEQQAGWWNIMGACLRGVVGKFRPDVCICMANEIAVPGGCRRVTRMYHTNGQSPLCVTMS